MDSSIWLQVENKVRVLIKDLLEPTSRRLSDTMKQVEKLGKTQSTIVFKLEDVDLSVLNLEKRLSSIDEYTKKILEFESIQAIMESRFNREREELRSEISLFSKRQENFEEYLEVLQHQKDALRTDITIIQQVIPNNKLELEEKISQVRSQFKDTLINIESKFMNLDLILQQNKKAIETISNEIVQIDAVAKEGLRIANLSVNDIKIASKKIEVVKEDASKDLEKVRGMSFLNANDIQKNSFEIKRIERKIINDESALKNEILITEPLYTIIKDLPTLKLLAAYDIERLEKLDLKWNSDKLKNQVNDIIEKSKIIIDTPLPDPKLLRRHSESDTSSKRKKREQKKNIKKKIAQNIAKNISRVQTLNLDKVTTKFQNLPMSTPEGPHSSQLALETNEEMHAPSRSSGFSKRPEMPVIISNPVDTLPDVEEAVVESNKDLLSISSRHSISDSFSDNSDDSESFIDFSPMIEHVKAELEQQVHFMYLELKTSIETATQSIFEKIENTKIDLASKIHYVQSQNDDFTFQFRKKMVEVELLIQQAANECNSASIQRKRDFNDNISKFRDLAAGIDDLNSRDNLINENIEGISKTIDFLIDFSRISMALQFQDEFDRESISLMGYKKSQKQVVSIDKRCLSCAGQSSAVLSAFKIACLAYEPSPVIFQDRKFTRKELLKLQSNILNNFSRNFEFDSSDEARDFRNKTMLTSKQWRPLSVPPTRFSTMTSPNVKTPDTELLPALRKNVRLQL